MKEYSLQRKATFVSSATALILMILKFIVGFISGSIAVLSSAIDSLMDLFVSMFNNFAVYLAEKRPNKKFNYWRWKIEAFAAFFEWIVITCSWLYVYYESLRKIIFWEQIEYIWASLIVMIVSVTITGALVIFLHRVAKKTQNIVIESDALHYKTDLYTNTWILIGLVVIHFSWLHIIDAAIWICISVYIIASAWDLIKKGFLLLMDIALPKEEVNKIIKIIKSQDKVKTYRDLKTRQSWNMKFVEVDVQVNECMLLKDAHKIADDIEREIKKLDNNFDREVIVHMEPYEPYTI